MFIINIILILQISIIYIILYNDIISILFMFILTFTAAALLGRAHEHSYIVSVSIYKATCGAFNLTNKKKYIN